jgi:oligopeptidase B
VLSYLEAENAFTSAAMADTEALQTQLYKEMRARIKEEDVGVATRWAYVIVFVMYGLVTWSLPCLMASKSSRCGD